MFVPESFYEFESICCLDGREAQQRWSNGEWHGIFVFDSDALNITQEFLVVYPIHRVEEGPFFPIVGGDSRECLCFALSRFVVLFTCIFLAWNG